MRAIALLPLLALAACWGGHGDERGTAALPSGTGTTRSFAVADFDGIDLGGSDDVDVRVGNGFSVRAEGPASDLDRLRIARDGTTLRVGRKGSGWGSGESVKVFVTLPRIVSVKVSGSGSMAIDRVSGGAFEAGIAGSGGIDIAALEADTARLSIAGSGDVRAAGKVKQLEAHIAGSGALDAVGLRADSAVVKIAGSGSVRATVTGAAQVNATGSGDVDLGPNARCTIRKAGSGDVRCGG